MNGGLAENDRSGFLNPDLRKSASKEIRDRGRRGSGAVGRNGRPEVEDEVEIRAAVRRKQQTQGRKKKKKEQSRGVLKQGENREGRRMETIPPPHKALTRRR
ncbi:hypothetical protein SLA2020_377280 [Shorea laevis]